MPTLESQRDCLVKLRKEQGLASESGLAVHYEFAFVLTNESPLAHQPDFVIERARKTVQAGKERRGGDVHGVQVTQCFGMEMLRQADF